MLPFVPSVTGFTPDEYLDLICARFENPSVVDTIARLCYDGFNRQPKFVTPSIRGNLDSGKNPQGLAISTAFWCCYCYGENDLGEKIARNAPNWTSLQNNAARRAQDEPAAWLAQTEIYGSFGYEQKFENVSAGAMKSLSEREAEQTIKAYMTDSILKTMD